MSVAGRGPAWGTPPWRVAGEPSITAPPRACEVAVVGAGFAGLAAARVLARGGADVVVLDAGRVGSGASGRTGGLALEGTHQGPLPGADSCLAALRALTVAIGDDCGLELGGCLEVAHRDPGESPAEPRLPWRDAGREVAVVERVAGGGIDPGRLLAGLARAARGGGARLCECAPVAGLEAGSRGGVRLALAAGALVAERVVLAAGAFASDLVALPEPPLPALSLAVCTHPLPAGTLEGLGLAPPSAFYTTDLPYLWGRTLGRDRLLIGAGLVTGSPAELLRIDVREGDAKAGLDALVARVASLHPKLAEVGFAWRWGGPLALLRGRAPLLGALPQLGGGVAVGGFTGHGVAAGVVCGEWAARHLLDGSELPDWGRIGQAP